MKNIEISNLLSRADELLLEEILGEQTIRILSSLDKNFKKNSDFKELILNSYGKEDLLLNKKYRDLLIDLLRVDEAYTLAKIIGINNKDKENIYTLLKNRNYRRGSLEEEELFAFFLLYLPIKKKENEFVTHIEINGDYSLFSHQRKAAKKVKTLLSKSPYKVLLHMPTGSGKTRTAMNIICDHLREHEPSVVLWFAATEELCEQASEEFEKAWSSLGNRTLNAHRFWGTNTIDFNQVKDGFIVVGLPKIIRAAGTNGGHKFLADIASRISFIIIDEAHQSVAEKYQYIFESLLLRTREIKLLGLSATPGRTWNNIEKDEELASFFAKRKVKLEIEGFNNPIDYLTENGYLADIDYIQLKHDTDFIKYEKVRTNNTVDLSKASLSKFGEDEKRNIKIILEAERLLKKHKRVILFAPSVASSNMLAFILKARGHIAYSLTSDTNPEVRRDLIADYKNNENTPKIICNYGVLTTGFDAPQTSAAIIARPTTSLVLYSQMIGRAIRGEKAGGNKRAEVVTVIDQGLPGFRSVAESFENWEDVWDGF